MSLNKIIAILGLVTIATALACAACASKAKADSGVTLTPVQVVYTLPGFSQLELYHDGIAVCHEADPHTCEVYLEDQQAIAAWRLRKAVCDAGRVAVWGDRLDEPAAVLGCDLSGGRGVLTIEGGAL